MIPLRRRERLGLSMLAFALVATGCTRASLANDVAQESETTTTSVAVATTTAASATSAVATTARVVTEVAPPVMCTEDALIDAVLTDNAHAVIKILECGINPNTTTDAMSVLHLAAIRDHGPIVTMLVRSGADTSAVNNSGLTPLMAAALQDSNNAVFELLDGGADPNVPIDDNEGRKAIHIAAANGATDVLAVFVENGLDFETTDNFGNHALIFAVIANQPEFVQAMLDTGMDPDLPGGGGLTAMDHAVAWNLFEVMQDIRDARWRRPAPRG